MRRESPITLWRLIQDLPTCFLPSRESIESLLQMELTETSNTPQLVIYQGSGFSLADELSLESIELRIQPSNSGFGLLVLELSGRCVSIGEIRQHYPEVRITQVPRGRSKNERTVHSIDLAWGRLSFGFRESNRDCLANVGFRLNVAEPAQE